MWLNKGFYNKKNFPNGGKAFLMENTEGFIQIWHFIFFIIFFYFFLKKTIFTNPI